MKELIKSERLNKFKQNIKDEYDIDIYDLNIIGKNSYLLSDENNNYFLKETSFNTLEKLQFLYNQGVNNILYPFLNKEQLFVSKVENKNIYISKYLDNKIILEEYRVKNMYDELNFLHDQTSFKKQLNPRKSRGRFDELSNQLDYKFKIIEEYIRSLESKELNPSMMPVLGNYQYILDCKKELIRLQKRIINSVKAKESINFNFVHNNPTIDHLLNTEGRMYLTSIDRGKIGISSLDMAKFYVENEYLDVDFRSLIKDYSIKYNNPFYYDYFRFLVLVIYIKKIKLNSDLLINVNTFIIVSNSIKKYFNNFKDLEYEDD